MRHDYDVFERFSDGSTLWRACIAGRYEAHRKIQELAEHSENEFYAIDIQAIENLPPISKRSLPACQTIIPTAFRSQSG
jgi:hypothetical protein